ncbi:uncharacterized protein LOC106151603 [Lingula anatina]|uniref:Uncharacterized protein LOC106151603 n=1 Tax=Lingula anatina TaxID=7574 RepID=A0A1S3H311_LINAN|nr:uncharacterized protein LOC106151603 [Lingula anatina]|eukprot:XP_013380398.1 uncharacterized protein LOC106151603 [Lingula anatina]
MGYEVLLYIPNIVGYVRLVLLAISWTYFNKPEVFLPVYVSSVILDGIDGILARQLDQSSVFGAWVSFRNAGILCKFLCILQCIYIIPGYVRLVLLAISWTYFNRPEVFLPVYVSSVILDGIDGILARQLDQSSVFGAWLDVAIDLIGRGMLWCTLFNWGYFVIALEWLVFVGSHAQAGATWKVTPITAPWLVQKVMEKNFKTFLGTVVILGVHILPVWLYGIQHQALVPLLPTVVQQITVISLMLGRFLALYCELWYVMAHIDFLLQQDKGSASNKHSKD